MRGCRTLADAVNDYFLRNDLAVIDIPVLQPADPFLDMAGEDLRRRMFMTASEKGDSLCLRPEFTIPVCLEHIAAGRTTPQSYACEGEVFRQTQTGNGSFYQAGIEEFGIADEAQADARSLSHATAMLRHIAPGTDIALLVGDHAVFAAVLDALGLPHGWKKKLRRCFGNDRYLRALMDDLAQPAASINLPAAISSLTPPEDRENALTRFLEQEMLDAGISPAAGRTPAEIAARLMEKQALSGLQLQKPVLAALEDFLAMDVPLAKATPALRHFAACHRLDMEESITRFAARAAAIGAHQPDPAAVRYKAAFGRALDYYTGFVYEIHTNAGDARILAGGGRYDRLLTMLGAKTAIPAVGFSIWLDRL